MPGNPAPVVSEADGVIAYLRQQRDGLRYAAYGLSDEQLWLTPTRSALSLGGLLRHVSDTERQWVDMIAGRPPQGGTEEDVDGFARDQHATLASLLDDLDATAAATEEVVAGLPDLGVAVTLAEGPWYPKGDGYTARWILLHVLEELSRHAGHADIIREHLDGATMYPLMAAAEGWPTNPWLEPWRPAVETGGG